MKKFPTWSAAIVGPFIGAALTYFTLNGDPLSEQVGITTFTAFGAGMGLLAGIVVWLLDRRKTKRELPNNQSESR